MNGINAGFSFAAMRVSTTLFWGVSLLLILSCTSKNRHNGSTGQLKVPDPYIHSLAEKIKKFPDSSALYQSIVDTLANQGLFAEAAAWCNSAMYADSINALNWLLARGDLLRMGKMYDSAIAVYRQYLFFRPEDGETRMNLATTLAENGDSTCLSQCRFIAAGNSSSETKANTAYIAGLYFSVKKQFPEARKWYDSAINLRYTFSEAWMERGYSFYDEGKYPDAEKNFRQLINISAGNADAWYWLGKSAEASGKKEEAINSYLRAFSIDPSLSEAQKAVERLRQN
jgi:tetratricopeptide (TPR) repeat protein